MFEFLKNCDRYELSARVAPGVLCAFPAALLVVMARNSELVGGVVSGVTSWVTMAGVQGLIVIGAVQYITSWGKRYEDVLFDKGLKMPTTEMLLWANKDSSDNLKRTVRTNLKIDFGLTLPNRELELKNEHAARVAIRDAVARIRLRFGKSVRIHERNIRYGFMRNLAAGARISMALSIVGIGLTAWTQNPVCLSLFAGMAICYGATLITCRRMIVCNGEHYAAQLLNEYAENGGKGK